MIFINTRRGDIIETNGMQLIQSQGSNAINTLYRSAMEVSGNIKWAFLHRHDRAESNESLMSDSTQSSVDTPHRRESGEMNEIEYAKWNILKTQPNKV